MGESPVADAGGARATTRASSGREAPVGDRIAQIAAGKHGLVTRADLIGLGLHRRAIARRVELGVLHREHRGVYSVGHPSLTRQARHLAAVLACGAPAVLSHRSAAVELGLLPERNEMVDVTVAHRRCRPGIRVHEAQLTSAEIRAIDGIPVTSPTRTLIELAAIVDPKELERAISEARVLRLIRPGELLPVRGRRGAARLRRLLDGDTFTRSEAERRLVSLTRRAQLPRPRTNVRVEGFEVDAYWSEARVIAEVDGFAAHAGRGSFERDRRRDAILQAADYRVVRFTWRQLTGSPEVVVASLAVLLHAPGGGA